MRTLFTLFLILLTGMAQADYRLKERQPHYLTLFCQSEEALKQVHRSYLKADYMAIIPLIDEAQCMEPPRYDLIIHPLMAVDRLYVYAIAQDVYGLLPERAVWILNYQLQETPDTQWVVTQVTRPNTVVDFWME